MSEPAGPKAGLRFLGSTNSLPPSPVPPQFKADVLIRIGADISAGGVGHILTGGDAVVSFRRSQCARCGGDGDGEGKSRFGEHGGYLLPWPPHRRCPKP